MSFREREGTLNEIVIEMKDIQTGLEGLRDVANEPASVVSHPIPVSSSATLFQVASDIRADAGFRPVPPPPPTPVATPATEHCIPPASSIPQACNGKASHEGNEQVNGHSNGNQAGKARADAILLPQVLSLLEEGVCFVDLQDQIRSWNPGAEAITGYRQEEVIGRSCCDRVFLHTSGDGVKACQEKCPSRAALHEEQPQSAELFLLHRDGHRVPVSLRVAPMRGSAGNVIGTIHIFAERKRTLAAIDHAQDFERFTFIDNLTGMGNRRYTEMALTQALEAFQRYGRRPALLIFDVDRLEKINKAFGREAGDQVLRSVARNVNACLRSYDFLGRWHDDEFFGILADTHSDHLAAIAEQCCRQVGSSSVLLEAHSLQTSISMGTSLLVPNDTLETWYQRASRNLREAKLAGGNQAVSDPVNTLFNWFHPSGQKS
jgi:diguanylate cyclase (GGDEF)-like protein/PAS domain S-box-containing protein